MKIDRVLESAFREFAPDQSDRNSMAIYGIVESAHVSESQEIVERKKYPEGLYSVVVKATLQEANAINRNIRRYSRDVINEAMRHPFVLETMKTRNWYGEANHPLTKDPERIMYVDMLRAAMHIYKWYWEGNLLQGVMESMILTDAGKAYMGAVLQGTTTGYSMRGFGPSKITVESQNGQHVKVMDIVKLFIRCYDWVQFPSHPPAYQHSYELTTSQMESREQALIDGMTADVNTEDNILIPVVSESGGTFEKLVAALVETNEFRGAMYALGIENPNIVNITESGNIVVQDPELSCGDSHDILVSPSEHFRSNVLGEFFTGLGFGNESRRIALYREATTKLHDVIVNPRVSKVEKIQRLRGLINRTRLQTEFNELNKLMETAAKKTSPEVAIWIRKYGRLEAGVARMHRLGK
jgi:hypothetical protein